jgi:tRNA nucleotidyltransferase/poly(A) polymerase
VFFSSSSDTKEQLITLDAKSGGWVRDKLLGVSGKEDIDIALDNMAGNDFAIALNKWHISNGIQINRCFCVVSICKGQNHLSEALHIPSVVNA